MTPAHRRGLDVAVPAALWLAAVAIAAAAGFRMAIPWWDWHILDARALLAHPFASLCHLHSQPPVLNALLAAVLAAADATGLEPATVGHVLFGALGLVASVVLYRVIVRITDSRPLAVMGLVLVVSDPSYHIFANLFFYEFPIHVLLVAILAASARYLVRGGEARLVVVAMLLAALALTRTLFHPIWAIGFFAVVVALHGRQRRRLGLAGQWGGVLRAALVLMLLLAAWPAKNAWVFGRFLYASMSSFSLTLMAPDCSQPLLNGRITPAALARAERALSERSLAACGRHGWEVVTAPHKSDGSPNWNHIALLAKGPAFEACVSEFIAAHGDEVLERAAGQYAMWTRASFIQPHLGSVIGPPSSAYLAYARVSDGTLFWNLRPAIERRWPNWFVHRYAVMRNGRTVPYTLFGVVLLPLLLTALAVAGLRRSREPGGAVALLVMAVVVPPMVASCLTDGQEGNRMRFATTPILVIGLCWLVEIVRHGRGAAASAR